jgi:Mn2+/Fe2+ NRAMP family transporter
MMAGIVFAGTTRQGRRMKARPDSLDLPAGTLLTHPAQAGSGAANRRQFWKSFGPGLVWAGTAIGVSHLVQSTRAGADAGFALSGVILLALVLKYPFFEFGPRYAAATGTSLIEGYRRTGAWALYLYFATVLSTAVFTQTAIVMFTSYLFQYAFGLSWPVPLAAAVIYACCGMLLWIGRYALLDIAIKVMLLTLTIGTVVTATLVLPQADFSTFSLAWPSGDIVAFGFLLALMGWMPSDIPASVYNSLWTLAKDKTTGGRTTVAHAQLDFNIGYIGTGILAFVFLTLGTAIMFGTGSSFSPEGPVFSTQLVELYSQTLGSGIGTLMMLTALATMFSTALTVLDGFPRVIDRASALIRRDDPALMAGYGPGRVYWGAFLTLGTLVYLVLTFLAGNLAVMIDFATTTAFVLAPIFGYLNLRAVTGPDMPRAHRPGTAMLVYAWVGLLSLTAIALTFLVTRLL